MSNTYHHLLINSEDRIDYANTNPANCSIKIPKLMNPTCIELAFAQFPNTFYNINSTNNAFSFNGTTYFVAPGCYNLTDLLQAIANLLNAFTTTITYNDTNNLITIAAPANFTLDFTVSNSIAKKIGFKMISYSGTNTYTGTYGPKLYDNCIFINVNSIPGGVITSNNDLRNASFVIPINVNKSEVIQFYSHTQFYINPKVKTSDIQFFDIRILDSQGVELQGLSDWILMLKITT